MAGAVKKGVARDEAAYIFELVDKFAGYGFNKAHTAAYAHVAYYTAYLKANYREEFLAASMTLDAGNTDKLAMYTSEAKKSGIAILPPCINASEVDFLAGEKTIRYSLAALKNIGAQAVESIVAERTANGAVQGPLRFRRAAQHPGAQQARAGDAGRRRRLRRAWRPTARSSTATSSRCWPSPIGSPATRRKAPATSSAPASAVRQDRKSTCGR